MSSKDKQAAQSNINKGFPLTSSGKKRSLTASTSSSSHDYSESNAMAKSLKAKSQKAKKVKTLKSEDEEKKRPHIVLGSSSKEAYPTSSQTMEEVKLDALQVPESLYGHCSQLHVQGDLNPMNNPGIFKLLPPSSRSRQDAATIPISFFRNRNPSPAADPQSSVKPSSSIDLFRYTRALGQVKSTGILSTAESNTAANLLAPDPTSILSRQLQQRMAARAAAALMAPVGNSALSNLASIHGNAMLENVARENLLRENSILKKALFSRGATEPPLKYQEMNASNNVLSQANQSHITAMATLNATEQQSTISYTQSSNPRCLPTRLAIPEDNTKLSNHQALLRHQIEAFKATEDDASTHTRGRNKPIKIGQVGIRCRHCAHLPVVRREKGSTYFPASVKGLYQAAQNMNLTHIQSGLCNGMPHELKQELISLMSSKSTSSGAGRKYWAEAGNKLGLVDTEEGIRFIKDIL